MSHTCQIVVNIIDHVQHHVWFYVILFILVGALIISVTNGTHTC